jgi:HTH-type transcriptional regulator/antitoxin HigA
MPNTAKQTGNNSPSPKGLAEALTAWPQVRSILFVPRTEAEYERAVSILNAVMDAGGANETHPLADIVDVIGTLIAAYEKEAHPVF